MRAACHHAQCSIVGNGYGNRPSVFCANVRFPGALARGTGITNAQRRRANDAGGRLAILYQGNVDGKLTALADELPGPVNGINQKECAPERL